LSKALFALKKDFKIFGEFRATVDEKTLRVFRRAGLNEVQIGIEALSTDLLDRMNKGASAIRNLEVMKHCEGLSIANVSNLILQFPGSTRAHVEQTLRAISFARIFRPLKIVHFWLGLDSPVYSNYRAFGLKAAFNHPNYKALFPPEVTDRVKFIIQDYRGDKQLQRKLWQPVEKAVASWKKTYDELHEHPGAGPILGYRDGRSFLAIRRRGVGDEAENHRLAGTSREIYLFCGCVRSLDEILKTFKGLPKDKLLAFLNMMVQKKLMYSENGNFLSLAVPLRACSIE
jgi:hypothetical protein